MDDLGFSVTRESNIINVYMYNMRIDFFYWHQVFEHSAWLILGIVGSASRIFNGVLNNP